MLVSEVNILRELRHSHIVRYYDRIIDRDNTKIYIVMEYCEGGDLAALIKKCKKERTYIEESLIWKIAFQILLALQECHGKRILHRDIKPANIFLDANQNVKLGDFGLARVLGKHSYFAHTNVGTPFYMSPEQVNEQAYNEKSDVWSLGCLVAEMASLCPPFEASNQLALVQKIKYSSPNTLPSRYSSSLGRIVTDALNKEPIRRPSVDDLLERNEMSLQMRERKVNNAYLALKRREEELRIREDKCAERERKLEEREKRMQARDAVITVRESSVQLENKRSSETYAGTDLEGKFRELGLQRENTENFSS